MNDANSTTAPATSVPQSHAEPNITPLFTGHGATVKPTQEPRAETAEPAADDVEGWVGFFRANPAKGTPSTIGLSRLDENTGRFDALPPPINAETFTTALVLSRNGPGTYRAVIRNANGQPMKHVTFSLASADEPASAGVIKSAPTNTNAHAQSSAAADSLAVYKLIQDAAQKAEERAEARFERMLKLTQANAAAATRNAPDEPIEAMQKALRFVKELKSDILDDVRPSKGGSEWVEAVRIVAQEFGPGIKAFAAHLASRPRAAAAANNGAHTVQRSARRVRPGTNTPHGGATGAGALQSASAGGGGSESAAPQSVGASQADASTPTTAAAAQTPPKPVTELERLQAVISIYLPMIAASAAVQSNAGTVGDVLLDGVEAEGIFDFVADLVPSVPPGGLVEMLLTIAGPKRGELEQLRSWLIELENHLRAACVPDDEEAAQ